MKYGRYGWSFLCMRIGLGIVFLWIGADMLRNPATWLPFLPETLPLPLSRELALQIIGGLDIALGTAFILNFMPKTTALISVAQLVTALVINGFDIIFIHDAGLLGVSLALLAWPSHRRRRRFGFFKRKSSSYGEEE